MPDKNIDFDVMQHVDQECFVNQDFSIDHRTEMLMFKHELDAVAKV